MSRSRKAQAAPPRDYADIAYAENTVRGYQKAWSRFEVWCSGRAVSALPASPADVSEYLSSLARAGRAYSTVAGVAAAIAWRHDLADLDSPTAVRSVKRTLTGIRRAAGRAPRARKAPLTDQDIKRLVESIQAETRWEPIKRGLRNKALILLGWFGAFRRSELVALDLSSVEVDRSGRGLLILVRRSKTDQDGDGQHVAIPYGAHPETCPVRVVQAWIDAAGLVSGPLFRPVSRHGTVGRGRLDGEDVARVVKEAAVAAGIDPASVAGHSLRSGYITTAARAGDSIWDLRLVSRHQSVTSLERYVRPEELLAKRASRKGTL